MLRLAVIAVLAVVSGATLLQRDAVALVSAGIGDVPLTLFTVAFCLDASVRRSGRMRWAWAFFGVFMLTYSAAELAYVRSVRTGAEVAGDLSNVFYLVAFVPGTIALFVYPAVRWRSGMFRPLLLDGLVLSMAVVHITHTFVLRTLFEDGMSTSEALWLIVYPIGSGLGAALATLLLLRSTGAARADMVLIGLGFTLFMVGDNGYALVLAQGLTPFSMSVDIAYSLGALAFMGAAAVASSTPTPQRILRRHLRGVVTPVYPDVAALLGLMAAVLLGVRGTTGVVLGALTITVVGVRQVLQTQDAWKLRADLEARIDERTQELEELTEAYEQLDSIKSEFVTAVSHELRTPLAAIRGSLEMLEDGDAGELPPAALPMIARATRGSERLSRLVDDIIHLERLESGSFGMTPQERRVGDLVEEAVHSLCPLAQERRVAFRVADTAGSAHCDPDRVVQVLVNLLGNALKFSPQGGEIVVSARPVGAEVLVSVADQGRGIPTEELERVFDRFHQVGMDDSRQGGGTGLGLTICRRIVERHGGRIWAESEEGRGATFHFTLPAVLPREASADGDPEEVADEVGDRHGQQPAAHGAQHRAARWAAAQP